MTNAELAKRFDTAAERMADSVADLDKRLAQFVASRESCERRCHANDLALNGNGRDGLKTGHGKLAAKVAVLTWAFGIQSLLLAAVVAAMAEQWLKVP